MHCKYFYQKKTMKKRLIQKKYGKIIRRMLFGLSFLVGIYHSANASDFDTGTINGKVWQDDNTNGQQDMGELGLPDIDAVLWLAEADGTPIVTVQTIRTDANGTYSFANVEDGNYVVQFVNPQQSPTARYRVMMNADWTAQSHPTEYPHANAHFSGIIGANHTADISYWSPGTLASPGVQRVAETGAKSTLRAEIDVEINNGNTEQRLSGGNPGATGVGMVALDFTVSDEFPLMFLISMIAPSPDWIVGFHDLSLLDADGNWINTAVIEAEAYDAGTDSGPTYSYPNTPTEPHEPIFSLKGMHPVGDAPFGTFTLNRLDTPNLTFTTRDNGNDMTDSDVHSTGFTDVISLTAGQQMLMDAGVDFCGTSSGVHTKGDFKVMLEGPYDETLGEMQTMLNTGRGLLPGQTPASNLVVPTPAGQPYHLAPWNYSGTEGIDWTDADYSDNVVDWVLVSARTDIAKNTEIARTAALLLKDGTLQFVDRCALASVDGASYFVVEHRNHMGIMTAEALNSVNKSVVYDFSQNNTYTGGGTGVGQKQLPSGTWVMLAGDGDQSDTPSYDNTGADKIIWESENGNFDIYQSQGDFNMDGNVTGEDKAVWERNFGESSRVPR